MTEPYNEPGKQQIERYVIATNYDGRLVSGFKKVKVQYGPGYWNDPVFKYPNQKKPLLYRTRKAAEKQRRAMPLNQGTYVRKARPNEMRGV